MHAELTRLNLDCIILAAGASTRFKECKLLAELDGQSLIARAISCAEALNPARITVVSGAFHEALAAFKEKSLSRFDLVYCQEWGLGMGHSLACGAQHLKGSQNPMLILLADQAALTPHDLRMLWDAWQKAPPAIACSKFADTYGVPAIFPSHFRNVLMECRADRGAKGILYQHINSLNAVDLPHAEVDIDTPDDLAHAFALIHKPITEI